MANKDPTEYEEITFDNKDEVDEIDVEDEEESNETPPETNELQSIVVQMSKDYANYFNIDINQEVTTFNELYILFQ